MPGWDISPSGVDSVTSLVRLAMDDMAKDVKAYVTDVESAAASAGTLGTSYCGAAPVGPIGDALTRFMVGTESDVRFLGKRAAKSVNGAIEATNHYVAGDLEQAANAQEQAAQAPDVTVFLPTARQRGAGPWT
ncbi:MULTISPECIES: DUF6507 family protein [unclassified Streptomyces]|uniref:DUF6507 family protein n=1 Tax=Streptomyces TaxID=1883 RepID=UPI001CBBBCC2|nr:MULTISPECIES: DUF6507 family protein [unclassified Streptomyces]WPO74123.1 DUF6507 family protein [Streptomyces sp. KN37]